MMPAITLSHHKVMELVEEIVKAERKVEKYTKEPYLHGYYDGIYHAYYWILHGSYSDAEIDEMKKEIVEL